MSEDVQHEPFIGRFGAAIATSVVGVLLGWLVLNPFNASQKEADKSANNLGSLRSEVAELTKRVNEHQAEAKYRHANIDKQLRDRFTGADSAKLKELLEVKIETNRLEIERLRDK